MQGKAAKRSEGAAPSWHGKHQEPPPYGLKQKPLTQSTPEGPCHLPAQCHINVVTLGNDFAATPSSDLGSPQWGYKQIPKKGRLSPGRCSFTLFGAHMERFHPFLLFLGPFSQQQVHFSCMSE